MTAVAEYPYDATIAYRPSVEDLGGDALENHATYPPAAGEPSAEAWDNFVRLHAAVARMLPSASITLNFAAGAPFIESLVTMGTGLIASDFTLTDNGAGSTTIAWVAGKLPAMARQPRAYVHTAALYGAALSLSAVSVRVTTYNAAGAGTDGQVTIDIY
jgi:hypothetical protein